MGAAETDPAHDVRRKKAKPIGNRNLLNWLRLEDAEVVNQDVCLWNLPNEFFDTVRSREIRGHTARICLDADALDSFIHALLCAPVNDHRCSLTCEQPSNRQPYPCC